MNLIAERAESTRATGQNDHDFVASPCSAVCRMNAGSGLCEGCFRTLDEIAAWSRMDEAGKRAVWKLIEQRIAHNEASP